MRLIAAASVLALAAAAPAATASGSPPAVSASVSAGEIQLGSAVSVSGAVASAAEGERVLLQANPYPFRGFRAIASAVTGAAGRFEFAALAPDRNTRLRVLLASSPADASAPVSVTVDPVVKVRSQSLGPGRVRLSVRLVHTSYDAGASVNVSWFLAERGSPIFRLQADTPTRELAPGVSYASAIVDPPSRRFIFRVCLNPAWEAAMGPAAAHGPCPHQDFRLGGHAS